MGYFAQVHTVPLAKERAVTYIFTQVLQMRELISANNLHKSFAGLHAVKGVTLQVNAGEVVGFLGPNGAGKTTTMRMLTGFLDPSEGSVLLDGFSLADDPLAAQKTFGYLPEGAPAYPEMTVRDYLQFIARARGIARREIAGKIDEVAGRMHLRGVLDQVIETLSKGFKRRVGIAQAIIHDPPILIMDEPTDGLDPNQKHEVRELIRAMGSTKAIVLSTHILEEVEAVCTRAVVIASGRVVFDGTPEEFELLAPASVTRNRMDYVFRQLTATAAEVTL